MKFKPGDLVEYRNPSNLGIILGVTELIQNKQMYYWFDFEDNDDYCDFECDFTLLS